MEKQFRITLGLMAGAIILAGGVLACSGSKDPGGFEHPKTLEADSLAINEVFRPQAFFPCGNRVAVQTLEDTVFYVYGLPKFDFLYAFGRRGGGPEEFSSVIADPTGMPGVFSVRTHRGGQRRVELYTVQREGRRRAGSFPDRGFDPNYRLGYSVAQDSLLVGVFIGDEGRHSLRLLSLRNGRVKDSTDSLYQYTIPYGENDHIGRNTARVAVNGDRVAVAYEETQTLEMFRIEQGKRLVRVASFGADKAPSKESLEADPRNSKVAYVGLFAGEDYVYAVNFRCDMRSLSEGAAPDPVVEVFDWKGDPVAAFRLHRPGLFPVMVDEARKTIYARDPGQDFDRIYTFKYDL